MLLCTDSDRVEEDDSVLPTSWNRLVSDPEPTNVMFSVLKDARQFLRFEDVATDNYVFRLHYKATVILLVAFSLLLGSNQYFGDPIDCVDESSSALTKIINTYCWITGTW